MITISKNDLIEQLPDLPVPPGKTLTETLELLGMTQTDLARRMNRPIKTINEIVKGKTAITADTALQLERVLGVSSKLWLNLEVNYRMVKARIAAEKQLAREIQRAARFPYAEMAHWGWVKKTREKVERTSELLDYFGVVSFDYLTLAKGISYRKATKRKASPEALTAWLRRGELQAQKMDMVEYDKKAFRGALREIRGLTRKAEDGFDAKLRDICAVCGVAVVFVPHLKRTYVNGATRWLTPKKALIQLSIRNRFKDIFWFTFFHEAAHILLHGKTESFIDVDNQADSDDERDANNWAMNFLIPITDYVRFHGRSRFTRSAVTSFAKEQGIAPEIVVGRLQHDELIMYSEFGDLRPKLEWAQE